MQEILSAVDAELFGVWFLIGAALVFWMQAGFAMVETGFTRAKNSGNIIMKNLMDFCIGTVMFVLIGFSFLLGEDLLGFIGKPGFDIFTAYKDFNFSSFVFNLVFCATTATIVSGAMAERTKFLSKARQQLRTYNCSSGVDDPGDIVIYTYDNDSNEMIRLFMLPDDSMKEAIISAVGNGVAHL